MYKEPFASKDSNAAAALRVEQKIASTVYKVANPEQSDSELMSKLHDLCVLNRMLESHDAPDVKQ
jgi:cell division protein FtsL